MLNYRVFFSALCFILLPPDIQLIHRAENLQFCFIDPQNRIPKLWWHSYTEQNYKCYTFVFPPIFHEHVS